MPPERHSAALSSVMNERAHPQPPPVLFLCRVLKTPDPHQKALLTAEIAALWRSGGIAQAFDPDAPHEEPPARPARCVRTPVTFTPKMQAENPCALSNGTERLAPPLIPHNASLHPTDAWLLPANPAGTRA